MSKVNRLLEQFGSSIDESLGKRQEQALSLVPDVSPVSDSTKGRTRAKGVYDIELDHIVTDKQIRKQFDNLEELAESIRSHGVENPIIVRWDATRGANVIIAGERRYRAAKLAGLKKIPCIVKPESISESECIEIQVIENIQREDLNPMEEAKAYRLLMDTSSCTAREVAKRVGKNETTVTRALRYLKLPVDIQNSIATGDIKKSVARELARIDDETELRRYLSRAERGELTAEEAAIAASRRKPSGRARGSKRKQQRELKLTFSAPHGFEVIIKRRISSQDDLLSYDHVEEALEQVRDEVSHRIKNRVRLL